MGHVINSCTVTCKCSSNISALQLEKRKRMLAGLQLQNDPSSAETSHAHL